MCRSAQLRSIDRVELVCQRSAAAPATMDILVAFALVLSLGCLTVEVVCQTGLSQSDKQDILVAHNDLRGMVNPSASNMQIMVSNLYAKQV